MDATITVCAYRDGMLNPVQRISTLPSDSTADPSCAEIAMSADGRFVYASNRGHDSIARFAFAAGALTALGHTSTRGSATAQILGEGLVIEALKVKLWHQDMLERIMYLIWESV